MGKETTCPRLNNLETNIVQMLIMLRKGMVPQKFSPNMERKIHINVNMMLKIQIQWLMKRETSQAQRKYLHSKMIMR